MTPCDAEILEQLPVAVCACDRDTRVTFVNARARTLLRFPVSQVGVARFGGALHGDLGAAALQDVLARGAEVRDLVCRCWRADAEPLRICLSITPRRDDGGGVVGALLTFTEAPSLPSAEAELFARLATALMRAPDEATALAATTRLVGEFLQVQRCGLLEHAGGAGGVKVLPGWSRDGAPLAASRHDLQELGDPDWQRDIAAGPVAIEDVEADARTRAAAAFYRERGIRAWAVAPCGEDRAQWVALLAVGTAAPRAWTGSELSLLARVCAQVWPVIERFRAEVALRLITVHAPVVLAYLDRDLRIAYCNDAFAARWEVRPAAVVGRPLADVLGDAALAMIRPYLDRALAGHAVQFELEVPFSRLGPRFVRVSYAPDIDAAGAVQGILSAVVDISERRAMELALRDSEQRYRELMQVLPLPLYACDADGRLVFYNDAAVELWGRRPQLHTERWGGAGRMYDRDGRPLPLEAGPMSHALQTGQVGPAEEIVIERPDGARRDVIAHPQLLRDMAGRTRGAINILVDVTERKQAELARADADRRFRVLALHAPVGIFQTSPEGVCWFVNERWCALAGTSTGEAVGQGWTRVVHPDDNARVAAEWAEMVRQRRPFASEFRLCPRDGRVPWVQCTAVAFEDAAGRPEGCIGTALDITDRKAAEFALRESERRFRLVASRAPVGIFMANPSGETVFVNASWCTLAGLSPEEAHGAGWAKAIHPEDRDRVFHDWQSAVENGVSSKAEFRFLRRDGTITWVHGAAVQIRDANGRLTGYIGTVADFTEQKVTEIALRESEERFRLLADNIVQFAWICDADGQWLWINRRFTEYSGVTLAELNGGKARAIHHPDHVARVTERFARHIRSGEPWEDSFPLRAHDGTCRWFLSRAMPIRDAQGRITRWFGTNTDITDLRDAQEKLGAAQAELRAHADDLERKVEERTASLREAIAQMEEFSYSVSHDLRAPLRAMNAYAETLVEEYGAQLDERARDYLSRIQRSSTRMEKLTYDVLTYSRIRRAEIVLTPVDVAAVIRDLISQYAELQAPRAEVVVAEGIPAVLGHEVSLGQCLGNLLINAAKFVEPGVRPKITVAAETRGERVTVSICDNGIGIRPEHQHALFRVFERLPTAVPYEGTGIGLAIVRKAVEKMNGRCGVESDGVHGSRFWLELTKA